MPEIREAKGLLVLAELGRRQVILETSSPRDWQVHPAHCACRHRGKREK